MSLVTTACRRGEKAKPKEGIQAVQTDFAIVVTEFAMGDRLAQDHLVRGF